LEVYFWNRIRSLGEIEGRRGLDKNFPPIEYRWKGGGPSASLGISASGSNAAQTPQLEKKLGKSHPSTPLTTGFLAKNARNEAAGRIGKIVGAAFRFSRRNSGLERRLSLEALNSTFAQKMGKAQFIFFL
jgi:hypothetical protein